MAQSSSFEVQKRGACSDSLPPFLLNTTLQQLQEILEQNKVNLTRQNLRKSVLPKGKVVFSIDASSLFVPTESYPPASWFVQLRHRLGDVHTFARSILYRVEVILLILSLLSSIMTYPVEKFHRTNFLVV